MSQKFGYLHHYRLTLTLHWKTLRWGLFVQQVRFHWHGEGSGAMSRLLLKYEPVLNDCTSSPK